MKRRMALFLAGVLVGTFAFAQSSGVVQRSVITPEYPSVDDEIVLTTDFYVNCTYQQGLVGNVGNVICVDGVYTSWVNCAPLSFTKEVRLGKLPEGEYILRHCIMDLDMDDKYLTHQDTLYFIKFTVAGKGSDIAARENASDKQDVSIRQVGQEILCTDAGGVRLELYTSDAMKVGEASFQDGRATVPIPPVSATYLYVVTYPGGRQASGKVVAIQ